MPLTIAMGPYRATTVKDLTPLKAPNPACCSDPSLLCGNCAAMVLRQAGFIANEEQGDDDLDDDDEDWEEVDDDPDDDLDDEYFDPFDEEESEMIRNVDKSKLTYVGLPGEMTAGDPVMNKRITEPSICTNCASKGDEAACNSCTKTKRPEQTVKRGNTGIPLTYVPCPGEEGKQR